jgi:hypothetical protein
MLLSTALIARRERSWSTAVFRRLVRGVEIVSDEPLEGYHRVYVYDPFGNRLELLEPSSD